MNKLMDFMDSPTCRPELLEQVVSEDAFKMAIAAGRLSDHPCHELYAGNYMYMGGTGKNARFKHVNTREYIA